MIPILNNIDEEDYWVMKEAVKIYDDVISLWLRVKSDVNEIDEEYELVCRGIKYYNFCPDGDGDIFMLSQNHPLILEYTDEKSELYCQIQEKYKNEILGIVLNSHHETANDWIDHFKYVNTVILKGWDYGMLANGPSFLINSYFDAINPFCKNANVLNKGPQKDWDGSKFIERDKNIKGICFGNSYIITSQYELANK